MLRICKYDPRLEFLSLPSLRVLSPFKDKYFSKDSLQYFFNCSNIQAPFICESFVQRAGSTLHLSFFFVTISLKREVE